MKIFFSFKFQEDKYLLRKQTWQLNQLHVFLETDASKNTNNVQLLPKCWEKKNWREERKRETICGEIKFRITEESGGVGVVAVIKRENGNTLFLFLMFLGIFNF